MFVDICVLCYFSNRDILISNTDKWHKFGAVSMKPVYSTNVHLLILKLFLTFWYYYMLGMCFYTIVEPHYSLAFVLTQSLYAFSRVLGLGLPDSQIQTA